MAGELGPFPGYKKNAENMLRVIRNHRRAAHGEAPATRACRSTRCRSTMPGLPRPGPDRPCHRGLGQGARARRKHGYRNAQATVIAPTGTIGLVMDCDTTGIEPDFALVKFKKLAGGGYFKIINRAVPEALRTLGYTEARSPRSRPMPSATARNQAPGINPGSLKAKGFTDTQIEKINGADLGRLRHQVRLQPLDARRGLLPTCSVPDGS
jgi:ribonucleoside-diphosphate reductase alpha chain